MKKLVSACTAVALSAMLGIVPAVSAADATPKLIAHYDFSDAANVGKDSAGSGDMKVLQQDGTSAAEAKVVEGPNGLKALEFNQDYALATDKKDVLDGKKEFTVTFLVAANSDGKLTNNMFTTGLSDNNNLGQKGINVLMNGEGGYPEVRLYGSASDSTHGSDPQNKWGADQFKNDDREIGKTNWKNYTKPTATDWYRVVVTVKLSDGTKGEQKTNANNEKYTEGTGVQTCYIEKIGGVSSKADLVANKNYYSYNLPYGLTDISNPNHGIALGACYTWKDADGTNTFYNKDKDYKYSMFKGKMADVRIYDKALTQNQVVELFTKGDVTAPATPDSKPSGGGSPSTGAGPNFIPVLIALPAAAVACGLVLRKKKASK